MKEIDELLLSRNIGDLDLSGRSYRALRYGRGIGTLGDLLRLRECDVLLIYGLGEKSLIEIKNCLAKYNLKLKKRH